MGRNTLTTTHRKAFKQLLDDGDVTMDSSGLGWVFWPIGNKGAYDTAFLRYIADSLEVLNEEFFKGAP